ncbi:hypothetical protein IBX65_01740 [Candidatus Aerophobetes bacterium]|nr:hypothetical protein [Candidatus Aerophobetes bacterium]
MRETFEKILHLTEEEFSDILKTKPAITGMKLRIYLIDGSLLDVYYHPTGKKYSFHWQKKVESIRINTAPHHKNIISYPRHMHIGQRIKADEITDVNLSPEENLRRVLTYIKAHLGTKE